MFFSFKNLCVKYIVVLVQNERAKSNNVGEISMKCALLLRAGFAGRVIHSSCYWSDWHFTEPKLFQGSFNLFQMFCGGGGGDKITDYCRRKVSTIIYEVH